MIQKKKPEFKTHRLEKLQLFDRLMDSVMQKMASVDRAAAASRVEQLHRQHPELDPEALADRLIRDKCRKAATVGAVTSAAALVPGIGTLTSLSVGMVADLGSTLQLQAELVLEISALFAHHLTEREKRDAILLVMGFGTGVSRAATNVGGKVMQRFGQLTSGKWLGKAVPVVGMAAAASTNVLSTYLVGKRAIAYFSRGPEAMGDWKDSLRALTGIDHRKITKWSTRRPPSGNNTAVKPASSQRKGRRWLARFRKREKPE